MVDNEHKRKTSGHIESARKTRSALEQVRNKAVSNLTIRPQDLGIGRLFESVRDAVIVADVTTGRIVLWNPAAADIFGYPPSEALGLSVEALVPDRLKERHRVGMSR